MRTREVAADVLQHARLRLYQAKGQRVQKPPRQQRLLVVGHAARFPLDRLALLPQGQLQQEKILECEPAMRRSPAAVQVFEVRIRSREMDGLDRVPERYEPPPSHDLGWQGRHGAVDRMAYQSLH